MFERDYLMRMILDFVAGIRRSMERTGGIIDYDASARLLETSIGEAVDMDAETFLSLSPDSIATIMNVSGVDPRVTEYIARSLLLVSSYYQKSGDNESAELRKAQALSIAQAYGFGIDDSNDAYDAMQAFLDAEKDAGRLDE